MNSFFSFEEKKITLGGLPATFLVVTFYPQEFFSFRLPFFEMFWFSKILFGHPNIPQRYLVYITWTRT